MAPRKPTAREAWEAIDEGSFQAEVERIAALSDAELEAELAKDGFEAAALEGGPAEAARGGSAEPLETAPAKKPAPVRRLPVRTKVALWLAAAAVPLAVAGAVAVNVSDVVGGGRPDRAQVLRKEARDACVSASWQTCLDRLDEADAVDPAGAGGDEVKALRKKAQEELGRPR